MRIWRRRQAPCTPAYSLLNLLAMKQFFQAIPRHAAAIIALTLMIVPVPGLAASDALIEGARLCTQRFPIEEQKNVIPTHLLAAIATTESGRWHDGLGMNVPWPWTINVDGKGYFFNSKAEAIAQTQRFLGQGRQSIDVGCMQVNLKHHPKAFANLNEAFDPVNNVAYAAKFLHDNYADLGDWIKATAAYHSRTPVHGNRYLAEIERSWNRIVAKVSAARASQAGGGITTAALGSGGTDSNNTPPRRAAVATTEPVSRMRPIASTYKVKSISVREGGRDAGVLVIRTPPSPSPAITDATSAVVAAPVAPTGNSIRRVALDSVPQSGVAVTTPPKSTFVFQN